MPRKVVARFLRPFAARLRELGTDPIALAASLGLADFEKNGREWLTPRQVRDFCERGSQLSRDPHLGLNAALARPSGSFGLVEFAARSTPTLRDALEFRIRYSSLLHESAESFLDVDPTEARCGFLVPEDPEGLGRHAHEFYVVSGLKIIRDAIGEHWTPARVWFSHPAPGKLTALSKVFGTERIQFDQADSGLGIEPVDLSRPQRFADPALFKFLEKQAREKALQADEGAFASDLRQRLKVQLQEGSAEMEDLAKRFRMSARTLHRRLAAEQLTFQKLLDQVRREVAEALVGQSQTAIDEISARLAYTNLPAFLRAFKRWTGLSPTAYRQRARGL